MTQPGTVMVDGRAVAIEGERNLLELIRKAGIDIPTFCYHSALSVYGACRLCLVDIEGRGVVTSCSTAPEPGMVVKTHTDEIRQMRKVAVELLLANHDQSCPTCPKSTVCRLQELAKRLGVDEVRFKRTQREEPVDRTSPSLVRDPNKCILCGDCVRMCTEVQGIGAIDFAHRGSQVSVQPAFGKDLGCVECVYCGQCASVCPTGALTARSYTEEVWKALNDPTKTVVAQIAPAVRVALGECFGLPAGSLAMGQIVAALRAMGFDRVFDTCFAADLTVIEEGTELLKRVTGGGVLPQFSSCCPGWVKFAEQYYPDLLPNVSSCRSPQQMFGALGKATLPQEMQIEAKDLVIVSIMPCTAKKFEARRPEFETAGIKDVDWVITTQELAAMIQGTGLDFTSLQPESLDMPLGFKTGAGVIFGNSGGVSEAVLRFAAEELSGLKLDNVDFPMVRGNEGVLEATVKAGEVELKLAVVHGLANARELAEKVRAGEADYHFIEVMACPGGCVGGAGQPVSHTDAARVARTQGLYATDKTLQLHKAQDNPYLQQCYQQCLDGEPCGHKAHELLHTHYQSRKRISDEDLSLVHGGADEVVPIRVCVGTSCFVRGAQELLHDLVEAIESRGLQTRVDVGATFCFERCDRGPTVRVGDQVLERCTLEMALGALDQALSLAPAEG